MIDLARIAGDIRRRRLSHCFQVHLAMQEDQTGNIQR
jgi:hypothetical protein